VKVDKFVNTLLVGIAILVVGCLASGKYLIVGGDLHSNDCIPPVSVCVDFYDDYSSPSENFTEHSTTSHHFSDSLDFSLLESKLSVIDSIAPVYNPKFFILVSWFENILCVFVAMMLASAVASSNLKVVGSCVLAQPIVRMFERSYFQFRMSHQI
jgi:hypothetical protein